MEAIPGPLDSRESRLLSLPPEIRNMIHRYALVEEGAIEFRYPYILPALPAA